MICKYFRDSEKVAREEVLPAVREFKKVIGNKKRSEAEEYAYETFQFLRIYGSKAYGLFKELNFKDLKRYKAWGRGFASAIGKYCNFIIGNSSSLQLEETEKRFADLESMGFIEFFTETSFSNFQKRTRAVWFKPAPETKKQSRILRMIEENEDIENMRM